MSIDGIGSGISTQSTEIQQKKHKPHHKKADQEQSFQFNPSSTTATGNTFNALA
jgi:hypothetical protein